MTVGILITRDELNALHRAVEAARLERDQARADVRRLRTHLATLIERQRDWLALGDHDAVVVAQINCAQAAIDLSLIHDQARAWRDGAVDGDVAAIAPEQRPAPGGAR